MSTRARRVVFRGTVGALVVASVVGSAGRAPRRADADSSFGSFALSASAAGVNATEDRADAVAHPEGQGAIPWTTASLSAGPVAYGLSTIAWPGAIVGNAGKLANVALPSTAGGVPIPDAVRQVILSNADRANYPIRAEAQNGSTPDATYDVPGTTLKAHADEAKVEANAAINGADQAGAATYGNMTARSATTLGSTGVSEASSLVQDVVLADGAVKIGAVRSSAKAVTDGAKATSEGKTMVADLEIGGQKAYVDETGVHSGEQGQPVNAVSEQLLGKALDNFGIAVFLSTPRREAEGARAAFDAGSLIVTWHPPSDQAPTFVWSLGGARVAVDAQPGDAFDVPVVGGIDAGALGPADLPAATPALGDVGSASPSDLVTPSATSGGPKTSAPSSGGAVGSTAFVPISNVFDGNPASWVLAALAAAALLGALAKRLAGDLVDGVATSCPLDPGARP